MWLIGSCLVCQVCTPDTDVKMTVKKWFTPPARAHGNASATGPYTRGQGMCGDHWEHLGQFPHAVHGVVHNVVNNVSWREYTVYLRFTGVPGAHSAVVLVLSSKLARCAVSCCGHRHMPRPLGDVVHADYDGLEEFKRSGKKGPRLRKLKLKEGVSAIEQLRDILSVNFGTVLKIFQAWDEDKNQTISKDEFRQALPVLGIAVDRKDADALFDLLDIDASGEVDYNELYKQLRAGAGVEIDEALREGAAGEIDLDAKNKISLRGGVLNADLNNMFGDAFEFSTESEVPITEQLKRALASRDVLARVIDIFRSWECVPAASR